MNEYTVIDIETTGLKPEEGAEITEIAGANVKNGEVITTFSSCCYISGNITEFIKGLTGITNEMVKAAPGFEEVFINFMNVLKIGINTNLVIHNVEFDYNFIDFHIKDNPIISLKCKNNFHQVNKICSLEMARKLFPGQSAKMEVLKQKYGIKTKSHRALNDVLVTNKVYQELLKEEKKRNESM